MCKDFILSICIIVCSQSMVYCQSSAGWKEEVNVYNKIYDAPITMVSGKKTSINTLAETKPLIIALVFTRCYGICTPLLLQLKESLPYKHDERKYEVLVVSFDSRDKLKDMQQLRNQLQLNANSNWKFAITDSISRLVASVGFNPVWHEKIKQFEHDALLVGVNSQGYISKKLIGLRSENDLSMMISSINNIFTPTYRLPGKSAMLSCFNYNPVTGKNTPGLGLLLIALPAILSMLVLIVINKLVHRKEEI